MDDKRKNGGGGGTERSKFGAKAPVYVTSDRGISENQHPLECE